MSRVRAYSAKVAFSWSRSLATDCGVGMATLDQSEAGTFGPGREVVLVDEGTQDHPGQVGQADRDDVLEKASESHHLEATGLDEVYQLHGAVPSGGAGEAEAQL